MLLKNAERIVKRTKRVILFGETGAYWMSDGVAVFPLPEFRDLGFDSVMALLSVPDEETDKWRFESGPMPEKLSFADTDSDEAPLEPSELRLCWKGTWVQPLNAEDGSVFVQLFYTDAFRKDQEDVSFWLRKDRDGQPYIAVKAGLLLVGIIMPLVQIPDGAKFRAELIRQSFRIGETFREDDDGQLTMEGLNDG